MSTSDRLDDFDDLSKKFIMSFAQEISYRENEKALKFSARECELIARIAGLAITFKDTEKPGKTLIKKIDTSGFSLKYYKSWLETAFGPKRTFYKPQSKIAILIAHNKYLHQSKLAAPPKDCTALALHLKDLGFVVLKIENLKSCDLKELLKNAMTCVPEDSYCLIFYAGHGCEINNQKVILDVTCPTENITTEHCVPENYILSVVAGCKPALCVLILDMCIISLERCSNPVIYSTINDLKIAKNTIIAYSTDDVAIEDVLIDTSSELSSHFQLRTRHLDKVIDGCSPYRKALCKRIYNDFDVSSLLDAVHRDVEKCRLQSPKKIQYCDEKFSFHDPVAGNPEIVFKAFDRIIEKYQDCSVFW